MKAARFEPERVAAVEPHRNHPPMFCFTLLVKEEWPALRYTPSHLRRLAAAAGLDARHVAAEGWVYQNKTPAFLARRLARRTGPCPLAAYIVGVFEAP